MKTLLTSLLAAVLLLPMYGGSVALAKSSENKANCESWCSKNKPDCAFCDSKVFCGGKKHDVIKSFKKGTGNWYACGLSSRELASRDNERKCKQWCAKREECQSCTPGVCGKGIKLLKVFGGKGRNWHACQKTNWARHSEQSLASAQKWCKDYTRRTGDSCKVIKSGKRCPQGYYKSDRMKVSWGRDYKVCLKSKSGSQRIKDCPSRAVADIESALDWINVNYSALFDDFRMQPRDYRDRRAHERYERKFPQVTVTCEDHRKKCQKKDGPWGWSTGGRYVHVCYSKPRMFCQLVALIVHEGAHNAWVDDELSQHVGDPGDQDDTVYQLTWKAMDICQGKIGGRNDDRDLKAPSGKGHIKSLPHNLDRKTIIFSR